VLRSHRHGDVFYADVTSRDLEPAGYSGTPLPKKLGFKPGQTVAFVGLPDNLKALTACEAFAEVDEARVADELGPTSPHDIIHAFYTRREDLQVALSCLKAAIKPAGMIWISWPKKASRVATDITEDVVRSLALERGLVDVKVCAVDEVWSGLKLVIPIAQRPAR
jgi:hypothetical protein